MVGALLSLVGREIRGMHRAAYLLACFALLSQILALVRDRLLAATFGAGHTLDIYYAAFRIPDFLFVTVASLLSLYALLPVLSRFEKEDEGRMVYFIREILLVFFVVMGIIAAAIFILAPILIPIVAPGISDVASRAQLIFLTRILLLQPILLGASNILAALTQLRHRFFLYSISPLLYNIGIIIGITLFYKQWGVAGLGWGVVLGALLHAMVQAPFFFAEKATRLPFKDVWKPLFEVLMLSIPRTLALAAGQISLMVLIALASFFAPGSISVFMFAWNLQAVPLTIIGVSYSVAAFPTLARFHAAGNTAEFVKHIETALRHILFWSIPVIFFVVVLRAYMVRVILGTGAFDWDATRLTAAALALFIISLTAQSMVLLIARAYYAVGKTSKPLYLGALSVSITISSAFLLIAFFHASAPWRSFLETALRVSDLPGTTVLMLALAYTLGALVQCGVGLKLFAKDFNVSYKGIWRLLMQSAAASFAGSVAIYAVLSMLGPVVDIRTVLGIFAQGAGAGVVGSVVTISLLLLMKNEEVLEVYNSLWRRFFETPQVALEPTDVSS